MEWISGIARDENGQLRVLAQWLDGNETLVGLDAVDADLDVLKTRTLKTTLKLYERRAGDVREYLCGLGLEHLKAEAQPVYEYDTEAGTLVVPAQLLTLATFGSQQQLRQELLSPQGPRSLMTPLVNDGQLSIVQTPGRMRNNKLTAPMIAVRLAWLLCYPSGSAAWGSVYANALRGRFDSLPVKAFAEAVIHGRRVGSKVLVTSLQFMALAPDEEPHDFARGLTPTTFVLNTRRDLRPAHGRARAPSGDAALQSIANSGALSDSQWAAVEPFLLEFTKPSNAKLRGAPRKHALRTLTDLMVLKMGTQIPWSKVGADVVLVRSANQLQVRLANAGVWQQIVSTLTTQ